MSIAIYSSAFPDLNRSLELAPAYEAAKAAQEKATEASTANYAKKRSMLTEVRHFKEQREEIKQWEKLCDDKVSLDLTIIVSFAQCSGRPSSASSALALVSSHGGDIPIGSSGGRSQRTVIGATRRSSELAWIRCAGTETKDGDEASLRQAKKDQSQAHLVVKKRESSVKKAEKALEDRASPPLIAANATNRYRNLSLLPSRPRSYMLRKKLPMRPSSSKGWRRTRSARRKVSALFAKELPTSRSKWMQPQVGETVLQLGAN